jgi:multisubunit Na+/H+ antiporter MnhB subunit
MASVLKDRVLQAAKAFAGGLAGAVVSVLFTTVTDPNAAVNPDAPPDANAIVQLPNTTAEWVTFLVSVLVGFVLPFLQRNYPSVSQAIQQVEVAKARVAVGKQTQ